MPCRAWDALETMSLAQLNMGRLVTVRFGSGSGYFIRTCTWTFRFGAANRRTRTCTSRFRFGRFGSFGCTPGAPGFMNKIWILFLFFLIFIYFKFIILLFYLQFVTVTWLRWCNYYFHHPHPQPQRTTHTGPHYTTGRMGHGHWAIGPCRTNHRYVFFVY